MKQNIFKRIFIAYGIVLALTVIIVEIAVTSSIRENTIGDLTNSLTVQASLIADHVSFSPAIKLDETCRSLKAKTGSRITVIAPDGRVLGDSDNDSSLMENHAHRPEIQQAALRGTGMFIRYSDTQKEEILYVAYQARSLGKPSGFVRISVPLRDVDRAVNTSRIDVLLIVVGIILAAGAFSFWQFAYLRRLTREISAFVRSLVPGGIGRKLVLPGAGEFSTIADGLNSMSEEMRAVIEGLEQERRRLNEILQGIPDALLIMDNGGTVRMNSAAAERLFADATLQGKPIMQILRNSVFVTLFNDVRSSGNAGVAEITLDHPEERSCVVRLSPIMHGISERIGFVALFHDITQIRMLEQARKDFVANLSHEIRTPVTAIQGFSENLLDGALDDREHARKFIEIIHANSRRISSLVDDLMTISKLELGVITVLKTSTALEDVVSEVMTTLQPKAAAKNLVLVTDLAHDLGPVQADRERLLQIMTNLVDNAIKFTDKGTITVKAREVSGKVLLTVEDTGIGIPEKHLPRLGERFYRVDTARSREQGGTGLGLAIVKHLVKAHAWEMQIESTYGKGTKVSIFIGE